MTSHLVLRPNRSGVLLDIWEAVYSPVADDGYPGRLWDKSTDVIDLATALQHHVPPRILERIEATAPEGADLTSWRY